MTKGKELREVIDNTGISITFIADKMGCSRNRVYAILEGSDCTATEITMLSGVLHLTKAQRDNIFLSAEVN
jgi:plasmid maintenance system antidote protein VapI